MRDTIDMARESWIDVYGLGHERAKFIDALKHFEALVRADEREETNRRANASWTLMCKKMVAAEREACAKVCDDIAKLPNDLMSDAPHIAAAIRARGQA